MKNQLLLKAVPITLAVVGLGLWSAWWWGGSHGNLKERVPGQDGTPIGSETGDPGQWQGKLVAGTASVPTNFTGRWPWFRGPDLDNICKDPTPLARTWPPDGPPVLWKLEVGEGFAAPAIFQGRVYLIDYDAKAKADALRCLSLADGQEIWRYTYPVRIKRFHGMSRTIPAVTPKHVVSLGPKCQVICCDALSGELRWKMDLVREFGAKVPEWYAGQCPLVDGDRLILGVGGTNALVMAVDLETGKVLWQTPNPRRWQMTHASLTPVQFQDTRMYVYPASGGVAGVSAKDGTLLWETLDWVVPSATIPAPVSVGEGRIFLSGGYDAGSLMIRLRPDGARFKAENVFRLKPRVFGSEQQTPILFGHRLLGVRPKPDEQMVFFDLEGKVVWESGAANRFGSGPYLIAQDLLLVMNNEGVLTLAEANTTPFKKLAQAKVLGGVDSWGPMALADGRLIVRDMTEMVCLDVAAKAPRPPALKP